MKRFFKPFSLCILICILFLFSVTVKADDSTDEISITASTTSNITCKGTITQYNGWKITFKNTTNGDVKISDLKILEFNKIGSSTSGRLKLQYFSNNTTSNYWTGYSEVIAPGKSCSFYVIATAQSFTNVKLQYTATVYKNYNISNDKNNPIPITFDQEITGPVYQQGYSGHYYSLTLTEPSTVTVNLDGSCSYNLSHNDGTSVAQHATGTNTHKLSSGTYSLYLETGGSSHVGEEYTLKVSAVPYNFGTLSINWNTKRLVGSCSVPFTVTINGSPDTSVFFAGNEYRSYGSSTSHGWSGVLHESTPGYHKLVVSLYAEGYGTKDYTYEYYSVPSAPLFSEYSINAGYNKLNYTGEGRIQMKKGTNWITVNTKKANVQEYVVSNLKPDTKYTFRLINCVETKGKAPLYSAPSKEVTIITGSKKKPAVKSIKAYGYKTKYVRPKYHAGYYDALHIWHKGYTTGGYYTTTYKLKIKLKKKATGLKTKYLSVNGKICKLKGKTCVYTGSYKGKRARKKLKLKIATAKSNKFYGVGAKITKKVTLR